MLPRAGRDAVVARQRVGVGTDVGRALHVVVAAEDVGATARHADVAQRELQDARRAHDRVAGRVLGLAHAPNDGRRPVLGHHLGDLVNAGFGNARDFLDLVRRPLGQALLADLVHAVDAVVDVLLVLPAVLEDVMQHPEQEGDVAARADADVLVGLRRGAREPRVDDDHPAAGLLGMQHVQQRHRMRLGGVAADVHRALAVLHVVVRVGHRAVAPGIGYAGDRRRMADARLMIAVVGAPERHELAQQERLLVVVLGAADPEHGVLTAFLLVVADREQTIAHFLDRVVPRHLLPLAIDELHRRFQPMRVLDHAVLAHGSALGAVRTEVQRRVEYRLLPDPHAVLHDRVDRAADRAVRADGAFDFYLARLTFGRGFADHTVG